MCNMVTYTTSSVFAPLIRESDRPMVLAALQPQKALDYERATTRMQLENDCICAVPEFVGVAQRMGKPIADVILGCLSDDIKADAQLAEWGKLRRYYGLCGERGSVQWAMSRKQCMICIPISLRLLPLSAFMFRCWNRKCFCLTAGVPLTDIYRADDSLLAPPNSPWAALNGDFGLELRGHITRIAEKQSASFPVLSPRSVVGKFPLG